VDREEEADREDAAEPDDSRLTVVVGMAPLGSGAGSDAGRGRRPRLFFPLESTAGACCFGVLGAALGGVCGWARATKAFVLVTGLVGVFEAAVMGGGRLGVVLAGDAFVAATGLLLDERMVET